MSFDVTPKIHDDVIKWKQFPRYWPFVRGIHRSPVNSPHKGQWRGVLMFSLVCARINGWVNNGEAGDLRCHPTHCDVIVTKSVSIDNIRSHQYQQSWHHDNSAPVRPWSIHIIYRFPPFPRRQWPFCNWYGITIYTYISEGKGKVYHSSWGKIMIKICLLFVKSISFHLLTCGLITFLVATSPLLHHGG